MKIADAGYFIGNSHDEIDFFSNDYFLDHHLLRVKLSSLKYALEELVSIRSDEHISSRQIQLMDHWIDRKTNEVREFYRLKGDIIIIADISPEHYYAMGEYSDNYHKVDLLKIFITPEFYPTYYPHTGTTFTTSSTIDELVSKSQGKYHFTIETDVVIKPLASTIKTSNTIAFVTKIDNGRLLMLNDLEFDNVNTRNFEQWFLKQTQQILGLLNEDLEEIAHSAPDWINEIELEEQGKISTVLEKLVEARNKIDEQIVCQHELALKYDILKSILFTTGEFLEKGIAIAMEHLGITHIIPDNSETDLIIIEGGRYIAVEIKGVTGTASLKNSRQVEDWVNKTANQYDQEEVKGLLLINCYCHLPLKERTGILFPPNVVDFSKKRGHCLLTTISLLNMIRDFDKCVIDKEEILELINRADGVLDYV